MLEERAVNVDLSAKNQELQQQLDRKTAELEDLEAKMIALEVNQVNLAEQNSVPATTPSLGRSQEIDELVKEIEYCIGQLRK